MKSGTLIEGVLRLTTFFVGLAPQLLGLAFFASSVGAAFLALSLVAIAAMATLTFMPHFPRSNIVGLFASIVLVAESSWEVADSIRDQTDVAFSSTAGLALGLLWLLWFVWMTVRGHARANSGEKQI